MRHGYIRSPSPFFFFPLRHFFSFPSMPPVVDRDSWKNSFWSRWLSSCGSWLPIQLLFSIVESRMGEEEEGGYIESDRGKKGKI